jgi:hypothetical protein
MASNIIPFALNMSFFYHHPTLVSRIPLSLNMIDQDMRGNPAKMASKACRS